MQPIPYEDTVKEVRMPLSVALDEVYSDLEQRVEESSSDFISTYIYA